MNRFASSSTGRLVIFIVLGLIIGGVLGESLGLVLGQIGEYFGVGEENIVRNFFVQSFDLNFGVKEGVLIDLYMIKFRIGFGLKLNIVSIIGMFVSLYIMKWSGDR